MKPQQDASAYIEYHDSVAVIRLNRPQKRNALNYEMWTLIGTLLRQCEQDDRIRVILFSGVDETAFSAGADISEFASVQPSREKARRYNLNIMETERAIMNCLKPTIAMIHGPCVGGGCEIALACDFRFASDTGVFGITPAKLGIVYNLPGTKNLVELVGPSRAKDILYTGRLLDAAEAYQFGLIDRLYPSQELEQKTFEYARILCSNAPNSIYGAKRIIQAIQNGETEDTEEVAEIVTDSFTSTYFLEGIQAFMGKRKPDFHRDKL